MQSTHSHLYLLLPGLLKPFPTVEDKLPKPSCKDFKLIYECALAMKERGVSIYRDDVDGKAMELLIVNLRLAIQLGHIDRGDAGASLHCVHSPRLAFTSSTSPPHRCRHR